MVQKEKQGPGSTDSLWSHRLADWQNSKWGPHWKVGPTGCELPVKRVGQSGTESWLDQKALEAGATRLGIEV